MSLLLIFAFISGIITIAAPCIWPILPIVLSASGTGGKYKPLGVVFGLCLSFALFTLAIAYIVKIVPFDPNALRLFAVLVIGILGVSLAVPTIGRVLEGWVSRLSSRLGIKPKNSGGFWGGFLTGAALGIVWSPCAGPILATIATLAATRAVGFEIIILTLVYVAGVALPLLALAYSGNYLLNKSRSLAPHTGKIQQVFGIIMILTAVAIYTNFDKTLQVKLLDAVPSYGKFLINFESNQKVKNELNALKNKQSQPAPATAQPINMLDHFGQAPEFTGVNHWLNTDKPLMMSSLRGKVVLIDFWTYTCINCIRTLPYVTSWYEKYKDKGLVVVGVHTPEFEFEKKTENVAQAIKKYSINYPVAQDNDYATWNAWDNSYWPAKYLVDAKGMVRYMHFGEGDYDKTETAIQSLLKEAGQTLDMPIANQTAEQNMAKTPETYLGTSRASGLAKLSGTWDIKSEFAKASPGAKLDIPFTANKVFLVIKPSSAVDKIKVFLDDKVIAPENAGSDIENGLIKLDSERLYNLIDLRGLSGSHTLKLEIESGNPALFAFTFG